MDVEERVRRFLAEDMQAPREALASDYPLIANRIVDSLGLMQIVSLLETELDVVIEDEDLVPDNFGSISSIVRLVESKLAERAAG